MERSLPESVARLLEAEDPGARAVAWEAFLTEFSRLIHLAARRSARGHDDVMDRYVFVLERLRSDDYKRLRAFAEGGRSSFGTWLVVVSSRLCVDYHRSKYGRVPAAHRDSQTAQERRRLVDLVAEAIEPSDLADSSAAGPDEELIRSQARAALATSLQELSAEDRLLVRLRFEEELPMREVARALGLPSEFSGYRRLKVVLGSLRARLRDRGVDGPP